jgi:hypothetical protein
MAWVIKNAAGGYIHIADLNIKFAPDQIRDLDLIGRENAEKSAELKTLIAQEVLKELRKDPCPAKIDPQIVQKLDAATAKIEQAAQNQQAASAAQAEQAQKITKLEAQLAENTAITSKVLDEVRAYAEKFPVLAQTIKAAMENAAVEKSQVLAEKNELAESGLSPEEIETRERILALKEKKLEKNLGKLGKTVSESAGDYKESLDAMDELGI